MADRIRIIPHAPEGILHCGSFEVRFPDGRESVYHYWDDNLGRRAINMKMSHDEALETAKKLARAEQDKLDES